MAKRLFASSAWWEAQLSAFGGSEGHAIHRKVGGVTQLSDLGSYTLVLEHFPEKWPRFSVRKCDHLIRLEGFPGHLNRKAL
jgi:hypothetical protein